MPAQSGEPCFRYFQNSGLGNAYILQNLEMAAGISSRSADHTSFYKESGGDYYHFERLLRGHNHTISFLIGIFNRLQFTLSGNYSNYYMVYTNYSFKSPGNYEIFADVRPYFQDFGFNACTKLNLVNGEGDKPAVAILYNYDISTSGIYNQVLTDELSVSDFSLLFSKSLFTKNLLTMSLAVGGGYHHNFQWSVFPEPDISVYFLVKTTTRYREEDRYEFGMGLDKLCWKKLGLSFYLGWSKTEYETYNQGGTDRALNSMAQVQFSMNYFFNRHKAR